jgi:hypothetical protein
MSAIRAFGGIALAAALLTACSAETGTSSLPYSAGTVQEQLRSTQMAGAAGRAGTTSGAVTGVNPGTTGIVRADGTGTVAGTVGSTLNTDGTVSRPDSGPPSTAIQPRTTKRVKKRTTNAAQRAATSAN